MKMKNLLILLLILCFSFTNNNEEVASLTVDVKAGNISGYYGKHNNYIFIDSDVLDSWSERDSHGVLRRVPGINSVNPGGTQTILMNGFGSNQTKVLYRGVDMIDPSTPQGTPLLDVVSLTGVERVEIVKGAASSYYGSSAVAGVINFVPFNKIENSYYALYGDRYFLQQLRTGFLSDWYKVGFIYNDSKQNQMSWKDDNTERDLEKKRTMEIDSEVSLGERTKVLSFYSENELDSDLDGSDTHVLANQSLYGLKIIHEIDNSSNLKFNYNGSNIVRDYDSGSSLYKGYLNEADLKFNKKFINKDLVLGISKRLEKASSKTAWSEFPRKEQEMLALYNILSVESLINFSIGSRVAKYTKDNAVFTYNASLWKKISDYDFKVNYATGYRHPTLYEKYDSSFGNPNLNAEISSLIDLVINYQGFDNLILKTNVFSSKVRSKIDWISTGALSGTYMNVTSDTLIDGYSLGGDLFGIPGIKRLSVGYANINSRNEAGQSLRVPRHKATLDLFFEFLGFDASFFYTLVSSREDSDWPGTVTLSSYQTVDISLIKSFDSYDVFLKGINVFGEDYQEINGYNTLKGVWYCGAKFVL